MLSGLKGMNVLAKCTAAQKGDLMTPVEQLLCRGKLYVKLPAGGDGEKGEMHDGCWLPRWVVKGKDGWWEGMVGWFDVTGPVLDIPLHGSTHVCPSGTGSLS